MKTIGDLLARDLGQRIEEIIKVDQHDEESVFSEINEYVATDRIITQYREVLQGMAEAPAEPHEGVGVWISGFFGSGKSSFAKNLGYVLANYPVLGKRASDLFKACVDDKKISSLVDSINTRIPTEVIMFDISVERAARKATERMAEVLYTVLLRELGYSEDYDIAELEISLEADARLEEFTKRCKKRFGDWEKVRKGAEKFQRAGAVLNEMDPQTYPSPDSWAQSLHGKSADVTVGKLVERTFELLSRRRKDKKSLVFIVDEVGQYVARSTDKIEDLRAIVEQFGKTSKNLIKAKKAYAPVWLIATSQEKLDEVVAALDSKRVELAKMQDRFTYRVDMAPADIREVATKRVLAKKPEAIPILVKMFAESQGQLNLACRLEKTARKSEITEEQFIQFYPYLPHYVELSIDIMSGIRLQPGAPRHLGGSNRTIIKQAYEMLVSRRTNLAAQKIGALVTLDKLYELVEGNLSSEKQKDINDIIERFKDTKFGLMCGRVAKVICLLEFVRDLPRTAENISACLVDHVGQPRASAEVQAALEQLRTAQFVRETEEGWKLQTGQEKNWDTERRAIEPRPKDRNDIVREALSVIFSDSRLKTYRYHDLRSLKVGLNVDGSRLGEEGQIPFSVFIAESEDTYASKLAEVRELSRQKTHENEVFWVFPLTQETDALVANVFASREMVRKYVNERNMNRLPPQLFPLLENEIREEDRWRTRLRDKVQEVILRGSGFFRGVQHDGASLGKNAAEIFKKLFDSTVPDLYPKMEMGTRRLTGNEAEEVLKAANLNGLPQVFYEGDQGLNLVVKEGAKFVPNASADIAKEILDYLKREHSYGNKVTGKTLQDHFQGIGYGWDVDMLRLVLAVLLRAGSIEVTYQGRRFRNHQDPQSRVPFTNTVAFRSSSFAPRESIELKTLTTAVQNFEELTGQEVDVEESAIAEALKKLADEEMRLLLPVQAEAKANALPVTDILEEYRQSLDAILTSPSDDCVRILAGEGKSLKQTRTVVRGIRDAINAGAVATIRDARRVLEQIQPALGSRAREPEIIEKFQSLRNLSATSSIFGNLKPVADVTQELSGEYHRLYVSLHDQREAEYSEAIEEIKQREEWTVVPESSADLLLAPLTMRVCHEAQFEPGRLECKNCNAGLGQMESDIAALPGLKQQAVERLQELAFATAGSGSKITRVKLSEFFDGPIDSEGSVNEALERLRQHLFKLLAEGVKIILE